MMGEHYSMNSALNAISNLVTPVIRIADHKIGNGQPGPLTRSLQEIYLQAALA